MRGLVIEVCLSKQKKEEKLMTLKDKFISLSALTGDNNQFYTRHSIDFVISAALNTRIHQEVRQSERKNSYFCGLECFKVYFTFFLNKKSNYMMYLLCYSTSPTE